MQSRRSLASEQRAHCPPTTVTFAADQLGTRDTRRLIARVASGDRRRALRTNCTRRLVLGDVRPRRPLAIGGTTARVACVVWYSAQRRRHDAQTLRSLADGVQLTSFTNCESLDASCRKRSCYPSLLNLKLCARCCVRLFAVHFRRESGALRPPLCACSCPRTLTRRSLVSVVTQVPTSLDFGRVTEPTFP